MAGIAYCEEVLALPVVFAAGQSFVIVDESENTAAHENMRVDAVVGFNLFEALVRPIDAISTVNHIWPMLCDAGRGMSVLEFGGGRLVQSN